MKPPKAVVCNLSALAGPQREDRKVSRMTAEERQRLGQIADAHGCRDALRCLDPIADKVLAHKPKPKSKPARKRARRARRTA